MVGDHRGVESFHALLEIPALRTSRYVFRHGLFQNSAGIVLGSRQECPSLRARRGTEPPLQQRNDLLDKVVFIPTGHLNWGIPRLSDGSPYRQSLFAQMLDTFTPPDRDYIPPSKRMKEPNSILAGKKTAHPARTVLSALRERPLRLYPEHSPAILNVGFYRTNC